nr:hypothetical protein [Tanacetum cinerariifolium]
MTFHEKEEEFQMIEEEFLLSLAETPLLSQQVQQPTLNEVQKYVDCLLVHQDVLLRARGSNKGWAYSFHQDKASLVRVPVENVTLFSSAHLLREYIDSVHSNQRIRPTAPSAPLK